MEILKKYFLSLAFSLLGLAVFAQQNAADSIYHALDVYLENADSYNLNQLKKQIKQTSNNEKLVQLAKTVAFCNMGYMAKTKGQFPQAIEDYENAKNLYFSNDLDHYDIIEYCLKPLGNLYIKTQALSEAENVIKQYLLLAQKQDNKKQEVSGVLNLSVLYHSRGEFQKAIQILLPEWQKHPKNFDLQLNLASSYFALNELKKAKALVKDIFKSNKNSLQSYRLLAEIYVKEKQFDKAISSLRKAINIQKNKGDQQQREIAKLHLDLADAYNSAQKKEKAILELNHVYQYLIPLYDTNQQETPTSKQLYAETVLMDALDLQAHIYKQENKPQKALSTYKLATQVNDFLFFDLYAQESKLITQQEIKRRYEKMLDILAGLYKNTKQTKWLTQAAQIDGKAKGRVVSEAAHFKNIWTSTKNEKFQKLQKLQQESAVLINQIHQKSQTSNFDIRELTPLQEAYSENLTQQRVLYKELTTQVFQNESFSQTDFLQTIQHKADSLNQSIVSYFVGSKAIYQFIFTAKTSRFKKLTTSSKDYNNLKTQIVNYIGFFNNPGTINNAVSKFTDASHKLYEELNIPEADHLIIIPDGLLTFVPFQTLLFDKNKSINYQEMPFLIKRTSISYLLSLNDFLKPSERFKDKQKVLGFFPVFANSDRELSFSIDEAKSVKKLFPTELLMNEKASRDNFISEADDCTILHISTHALAGGFYQDASILFSDQQLSLNELYALHISPELVVLSACDTGIGVLSNGEGALSLARGFQYAGAQNVLMSLWEVNDKSTAIWMKYYYENLKHLRSRNLASTQASLDYLKDNDIDNIRKSPYYWAAFSYYGTTDLPKVQKQEYSYLIILGGLILFLVLCFFLWRQRHIKSQ